MSLAFVLGCNLPFALGKSNACVQAIPVNEIQSFVKQTCYFTSEVNLPVISVFHLCQLQKFVCEYSHLS